MKLLLRTCLFVSFMAGLVGCSSEDDGGNPDSPIAAAEAGTQLAPDSDIPDDASDAEPDDAAPEILRAGSVLLMQVPGKDGSYGVAQALFQNVGGPSPAGCEAVASTGSCTRSHCEAGDEEVPEPVGPFPHAGLIEVTGAKMPIELLPGADGSYSIGGTDKPVDDPAPLWIGGEPLRAQADGADVWAFALELEAPPPLVITGPVLHYGETLHHSGDAPLQLEWSGASEAAKVWVTLRTVWGSGGIDDLISCTFPSQQLGAEIPASLLTGLPNGDYDFGLSATVDVSKQNGHDSLRFTAWQFATNAAGESLLGQTVTIE